jgi:hypothetical protein
MRVDTPPILEFGIMSWSLEHEIVRINPMNNSKYDFFMLNQFYF